MHFFVSQHFGPRGSAAGGDIVQKALRMGAFALAILSFNIFAAEDAVVVTATRFPERALDVPIGITVISAERIAESSAATLPELLSHEAGIVTRDNTGSPDRQIDMRGFGMSGDQNTLVLLNGQRLNDIELTSIRWSAIPLDSIERIEILRGAGSVLYGGGTTGGTINIITREPVIGGREAVLSASGGGFGTRELRGRVSASNETMGLTLHFNDQASDNYRSNNRLEQKNVGGEVRLRGNRHQFAFRFGLDNQSLRLPGERTAAELASDPRGTRRPGDYSSRDGAQASLSGSTDLGFGEFAADFGYRDSARAALLRDYTFGLFDTYTDTRVKVWSFTPRLKVPFQAFRFAHSVVVGMDWDDWDYDSRRAGSPETLNNPAARVVAAQKNQAFYVQSQTAFSDRTKLTLGARQHRVNMTAADRVNPAAYAQGEKTSSPRSWEIGLRHQFTPATAVYGRAGKSFRITTVDESYSQFGGPVFDAIITLLEPQTSRDHELGIEHRAGRLRARASGFTMKLENEIHFFAPTFSNINLPPTRRRGVEFDLAWDASPTLSLFGNLSFVEAKFRDGRIGAADVSGRDIPLVPEHTANAGFSWRVAGTTQLNGVVRHVGNAWYDNDQTNTFPSQMPAYTLVDVKLTQQFRDWSLSLAANNLLDKQYYSYGIRNGAGTSFNAYPQAGRTLLATLELKLR